MNLRSHTWARRLKQANYWLIAKAVSLVFSALRRLPADRALDFADRVARRVGPWSSRHAIALDNLRKAFPEKSEEEIDRIASDMWANMARLLAEYVFLDQLFDYDMEEKTTGRVEVVGHEVFHAIKDSGRPKIFFTAHTGNFEMFPIAAEMFGLSVASLFRAPNNPYLASELGAARKVSGGRLVKSRSGAAFELARILENGGNIGALVDQKFNRGIEGTFFGRPCRTSPLLPKLARQYDCDVYPARCIRLPGNRYRLQLFDRIELPRDESGEVDAERLAQIFNDTVEDWVREYPGQWMWFHRRWEIRQRKQKKPAQP